MMYNGNKIDDKASEKILAINNLLFMFKEKLVGNLIFHITTFIGLITMEYWLVVHCYNNESNIALLWLPKYH